MRLRKAVFPVAGFGTRFLPATKAMLKESLPIVDKSLIQYAAEEAITAGIDTLTFVTGRNKRVIEDHLDANNQLETILSAKGKDAQADMVRKIIPKGVECIFVRQVEQLGLGQLVYVPLGARHSLENPGELPIVLIQVQIGFYLGSDDIVGYGDLYARA